MVINNRKTLITSITDDLGSLLKNSALYGEPYKMDRLNVFKNIEIANSQMLAAMALDTVTLHL